MEFCLGWDLGLCKTEAHTKQTTRLVCDCHPPSSSKWSSSHCTPSENEASQLCYPVALRIGWKKVAKFYTVGHTRDPCLVIEVGKFIAKRFSHPTHDREADATMLFVVWKSVPSSPPKPLPLPTSPIRNCALRLLVDIWYWGFTDRLRKAQRSPPYISPTKAPSNKY